MKNRAKVILSISCIILCAPINAAGDVCDRFAQHTHIHLEDIVNNEYLRQGIINNPELAYIAQKCALHNLTNNIASNIAGYKAGLTTESSRKRFNAREPVMGVLLKQHIQSQQDYYNNKINLFEIELAFKLKKNLSSLNDVSLPLDKIIDAVAPAIEIANFNFKSIDKINANDIVAANVGTEYIRVGQFIDFKEVDIHSVKISVFHDSEGKKKIHSIPDDYLMNIRWLIRKAYKEGYPLRKDMVLMAGSIIKPVVLTSGTYHVEFGALGTHDLYVR